MRIMLIGGTHFIGPHVVRHLLRQGHEVACFTRGKSTVELPDEVTMLTGDRRDMALDVTPLRAYQPDAVIDMCCITELDANWLVDTFTGHTEQLILVSSMDVYRAYGRLIGTEPGEPETLPITEDSPLREKLYPYRGDERRSADDPQVILDDYDKIPCERAVLLADTPSATVLRLPFVYGPGDYQHRFWPYLAQMTDDNDESTIPLEQADWRSERGYVEDIARGITLAIGRPEAAGRIYNICEEDILSEIEFARMVALAAGWDGMIKVGRPDAEHDESDGSEETDSMDWRQHFVVDSSRIRMELGYGEASSIEERYRRTIAWERENPPTT